MTHDTVQLERPLLPVARKDFAVLRQDWTVRQALDAIRERGLGEKIVYFYTVDAEERLVGVVPTRRLLTAALDEPLAKIMITRVVAIPHTARLLDACELFVLHKFLAFPVVDDHRQIVGVVDVGLFTEQVIDLDGRRQVGEVFEAIGFHISQVRDASPIRAFQFRFRWLLATIASGTLCALLAGAFETTLAQSLVLTFFLTLVLGLGESVGVQSMTVAIQALHSVPPSWRWYLSSLRREVPTALLLGAASGLAVGLIVWLWRGTLVAALSIGSSLSLALCAACFFGLSVPALLHSLKLDLKIAAGPVTLALTDLATLASYFSIAAWLL
jgi:magnesium transporter